MLRHTARLNHRNITHHVFEASYPQHRIHRHYRWFARVARGRSAAARAAHQARQAPDFAKPVVDGNQSVNQSRHVVAAVAVEKIGGRGGGGGRAANKSCRSVCPCANTTASSALYSPPAAPRPSQHAKCSSSSCHHCCLATRERGGGSRRSVIATVSLTPAAPSILLPNFGIRLLAHAACNDSNRRLTPPQHTSRFYGKLHMSKPLLSSINIPPSSPPIADLADCFAPDFLALRAEKEK